jgi:preprotein translocase subunit Sec63
LISKYHPDKVDSLGQELKDLAGQKSQQITAAYQEGMRARGEVP